MKGLVKSLFLLTAVIHLYFAFWGYSNFLSIGSKLLLMPLLLLLAFFYRAESEKRSLWSLMIAALFFSFLGDLFLSDLFDRDQSFIFGLGSFLLTQILYIMIFRMSGADMRKLPQFRLLIPAILILVWAVGIFMYIEGNLGALMGPVVIYIVVITGMCLYALSRFEAVAKGSFFLVLSGAILFMISDMFIALDKFSTVIENERVLVMSTYILAQYLILNGIRLGDETLELANKRIEDE